MFYFFRPAPLPSKVHERPLPRTGKLFLFLFFAFHVLFLGFNFYYFMSKSNDSLENEIGLGEYSNEEADIDTQI